MRNFNKQTKWRLFQLPCAGVPEHSTASARWHENGERTRPSSSYRSKHDVDSVAHPCSARTSDKGYGFPALFLSSSSSSSPEGYNRPQVPALSISCYSLPSPSRATLSTTITVIQSPARLASEDDSSRQVCWARQRLPTQLQVTGRLCIGCRPGRGWRIGKGCRPGRMWWLGTCRLGKGVSDPAGQRAPAVMTPARSQTPAQQWRDSEIASEDGNVILP